MRWQEGEQVLWVMEDVKGQFNNVIGQELLNSVAGSDKKGWCRWLTKNTSSDLGSLRSSGTGKSGGGSCNVGVLQGSPLSPVVFLIWMAPILEKVEARMKEEAGRIRGLRYQHVVDVEIPSFVDDMCMDIVDWEGSD